MKLRKWIKGVLVVISALALLICVSECEDLHIFVVSHIIAIGLFIACTSILLKECSNEDIY